MDAIIEEVVTAVSHWKTIPKKLGIPRSERELMAAAFMNAAN